MNAEERPTVSSAKWMEPMRRIPVLEVAEATGMKPGRGGGWGPCPACGATRRGSRDPRFPVGFRADGGGWQCQHCKVKGDGLTLLALAVEGVPRPRNWGRVQSFCAKQGWCSTDGSQRRLFPSSPSSHPKRVPPSEVDAVWRSCIPVLEDREVTDWLHSRGLAPALVDDLDLARALPREARRLPRWAYFRGRPWPACGHRLLVPMWGSSGQMESLHARCVIPGGPPGQKGASPAGAKIAGLVMGDPLAVMLFAERRDGLNAIPTPDVVVTEGVPDFLTWATRFGMDGGLEEAPAIFGVLAGSWREGSGELAARIPAGCRVAIRTHPDKAGDEYARRIFSCLRGRCRILRPPRKDGRSPMDENDALRAGLLPLDPFLDGEPMNKPAEGRQEAPLCAPTAKAENGARLPPFPLETLPSLLQEIIEAFAATIHTPIEMTALPAFAVVAAVLGPGWTVGPPGFERPARLWFSTIAPSGAGKTPAARPVVAPLEEIDRRLREEHARTEARHGPSADGAPRRRRALITDATTEALLSALQDAEGHGVLHHADELATLLAGFDGYRKGSWGRSIWLSLWSGSPVRCLRKTAPGPEVDHPHLAVFAGVQPSVLSRLQLKNEDGLVARILWAHVEARPHGLGSGLDPRAVAQWAKAIRLASSHGARETQPFAPKACRMLDTRLREWTARAVQLDECEAGLLSACYGKAGEHFVRLTALLHGLDAIAEALHSGSSHPPPLRARQVSIRTAERASRLLDYFLAHGAHAARLVLQAPHSRRQTAVNDEDTAVSIALASLVPQGGTADDTPTGWSRRLATAGVGASPRSTGKAFARMAIAPLNGITVTRLPKGKDRRWQVRHS